MALTPSTMSALGTPAFDFSLPDLSGEQKSLSDYSDSSVLLIAFICNHCPYVIHIKTALSEFAREFQAKGVAIVAVNANDATRFPEDGPEKMRRDAEEYAYTFPYLYDETQETAKRYTAACTPDFFLFDSSRKLVYRGQFDDSRPGNGKPVTGSDMRTAIDAILSGAPVSEDQKASMGCNIKWRRGNEPSYF